MQFRDVLWQISTHLLGTYKIVSKRFIWLKYIISYRWTQSIIWSLDLEFEVLLKQAGGQLAVVRIRCLSWLLWGDCTAVLPHSLWIIEVHFAVFHTVWRSVKVSSRRIECSHTAWQSRGTAKPGRRNRRRSCKGCVQTAWFLESASSIGLQGVDKSRLFVWGSRWNRCWCRRS
jgi:hypothetical protein